MNDLILTVDAENNGKLSFNQIGRILTLLDVFRELRFDEFNRLENNNSQNLNPAGAALSSGHSASNFGGDGSRVLDFRN